MTAEDAKGKKIQRLVIKVKSRTRTQVHVKCMSVLRVAVEICCLHWFRVSWFWVSSTSVKTFTKCLLYAQYCVKTQSFPSSSPLIFCQSYPFRISFWEIKLRNVYVCCEAPRRKINPWVRQTRPFGQVPWNTCPQIHSTWVSHSEKARYRLITVGYKCDTPFSPPPPSPASFFTEAEVVLQMSELPPWHTSSLLGTLHIVVNSLLLNTILDGSTFSYLSEVGFHFREGSSGPCGQVKAESGLWGSDFFLLTLSCWKCWKKLDKAAQILWWDGKKKIRDQRREKMPRGG